MARAQAQPWSGLGQARGSTETRAPGQLCCEEGGLRLGEEQPVPAQQQSPAGRVDRRGFSSPRGSLRALITPELKRLAHPALLPSQTHSCVHGQPPRPPRPSQPLICPSRMGYPATTDRGWLLPGMLCLPGRRAWLAVALLWPSLPLEQLNQGSSPHARSWSWVLPQTLPLGWFLSHNTPAGHLPAPCHHRLAGSGQCPPQSRGACAMIGAWTRGGGR